MAWIRTIDPSQARGALADSYAAAVARAGRVYQIVRLMSLSPRVLDASMGLYLAVMHGSGALSRRERELLAVVTSRANACHY
jgi:alkylhydroperoxidase family enzyme